jgi:alpha-1,3-mannosylglycoprotein beta-1,4-N-acetylglucosaminyltransferase C
MSDKDRKDVVIVVFAADFDAKQHKAVIKLVQNSYAFHVKNGLIQVITAPSSFYPPLENLKTNFGDSQDRVKWRAKQCLDYAFLLAYCKGLGRYYLQLEDDVITSRDFLQGIKEFIAMQDKPWITLDFSHLGFIGKLYHDRDVERLAGFLKFFYEEQPVDYLYRYFNALLTQKKSISRSPSLFQHIGMESTLDGKVQKRKDVLFNNGTRKYGNSDNPAAIVSTTLDAFSSYVAQLAYGSSPGYFWGRPPIEGDTFTVVFYRPEDIRRVVIETGDDAHPRDRLRRGRLEVSVAVSGQESSKESDTACNHYKMVKEFENGRVDAQIESESLIKCVRIFATGRQDTWLLVKEIAVWT